jgi:hypothetical protein
MAAAAAAGMIASFVELPAVGGAGVPAPARRVRLSARLAHFFELPYDSVMHIEDIQNMVARFARAEGADGESIVWKQDAIWTLLHLPDDVEYVTLAHLFRELRTQHLTFVDEAAPPAPAAPAPVV